MLQVLQVPSVHDDIWDCAKKGSTFILPAAHSHTSTSEEIRDPQSICGRPVTVVVSFPLIKYQFKTRTSRHWGILDGQLACKPLAGFEEQSMNIHGCCPHARKPIQDFRLVDVGRRCVARADTMADYAALNYVWAKQNVFVCARATNSGSPHLERYHRMKTWFHESSEMPPRSPKHRESVTYGSILCVSIRQVPTSYEAYGCNGFNLGAALLTIVSNTKSADLGSPIVSLPCGPP
jgi:hypothetical protein